MDKINLNSPEALDTISQFLSDPPVLLVGSAISAWEPTSLPMGVSFTKGMFDLLFPSDFLTSSKLTHLNSLWEKVPFEHLLEKCPDFQKLTSIIKRGFFVDKFNPIHEIIVRMLIAGKFQGVITTNYDLCLDNLFRFSNIKRVITENDLQFVSSTTRKIYFKIHGSADNEETLVYALTHEAQLPKWKRNLLADMLESKLLFVIGYSGLDFEICPELAKMPIKGIFWNITEKAAKDDRISKNARYVLSRIPGHFLVGDMRHLLSLLAGTPVNAKWGTPSNILLDSIKTEFTEDEIGIWRISLLNSMGCASLALKASEEKLKVCLKDKLDLVVNLKRQKAQALFHIGKYHQSADEFYIAAKKSNYNLSLKIALMLDSCDAYRCYGKFIKAIRLLRKARKSIRMINISKDYNRLIGISALKEALLWGELYKFFRLFKFRYPLKLISQKALKPLQVASKMSLEGGDWFNFQQTRLWAERMNIDPATLTYQITYEPPSPKEGYEHLGYHIPQKMCLRDQLKKTTRYLLPEEETNLEEYIADSEQFGNHPEIWKLSFIGLWKSKRGGKMKYWNRFYKNFFLCEYTVLARLFNLFNEIPRM